MAIMKTYKMGDLPEDNVGYGKDAKSPKTADKNVIIPGSPGSLLADAPRQLSNPRGAGRCHQ